jgi:hypothetical protein
MNWNRYVTHLVATLCLALACVAAQSQEDPRIGELSYLDRQFMAQQRALLEDLVRRNFGRGFNRVRDNDLDLLQMLLDRQLVRPDQTRELQAMGVVMGDLLASELALKWVVYEDHLGRSRALRDGDSDIYLFPITMISRRREVDNRTPVVDIYRKAADIITDSRPPLPFK